MRPRDKAVVTSNSVAFDDLRQLLQKSSQLRELSRHRANADEAAQCEPESCWIDLDRIAANDAALLQPLDSLSHSGSGQADLARQISQRDARIRRKLREDGNVQLVDVRLLYSQAFHCIYLIIEGDIRNCPWIAHSIRPFHGAGYRYRAAAAKEDLMPSRLMLALVCGSIILTLSVGLRQVFGLFLIPVTQDLSVTRETFGLIVGLQNLVWGLTQPIAGYIADRFGAARVVFVGGLLYVGGLGLAALSTSTEHLGLTTGILVGLAQSGTAYAVVLGAIGRVAPPEKRSMALGVASTAGSIGMFTLVPLTQGIIELADWRVAFTVLAGLAILMPLLALGLRESPVAADHHAAARAESSSPQLALAAATRHPSFWMLNAGFAACGFQLAFLSTHLPSVLVDGGLTAATGAVALAVIALSNIIGTYCCGVLGGRYAKNKVLAVLYLVRTALFISFLLLPMSQASVMLFAVAIGFIWTGTVPLTSGLVGDIFGTRYMGLLFGIVYMGHQLGAFAGAWAGGMSFDRTGSYALVWTGAILLGCLAAALHWPIRAKPVFPMPTAKVTS